MMFATAFIFTHFGLLMYLSAYRSFVCLCCTTRTYSRRPTNQPTKYGKEKRNRWAMRAAIQQGTYLSKGTLADTSEENKVEEIDVSVKVYRL